jgi:hypothetical protein
MVRHEEFWVSVESVHNKLYIRLRDANGVIRESILSSGMPGQELLHITHHFEAQAARLNELYESDRAKCDALKAQLSKVS